MGMLSGKRGSLETKEHFVRVVSERGRLEIKGHFERVVRSVCFPYTDVTF